MAAGWLQLGDLFTIITRPFKKGAFGDDVAEIDSIRGTRSAYMQFTHAETTVAQLLFTLGTGTHTYTTSFAWNGTTPAVQNAAFPNATRVRIVAMVLASAATGTALNFTFYDGDNASSLPTLPCFATQYMVSGTQNMYLNKSQLGDGGIIIQTGLIIKPSADINTGNNSEIWMQIVPEYGNNPE